MFEGVPTYPNAGTLLVLCEKHRVNIFYTAPTAIRALMREGEKWVSQHDLSSLRVLGTVGEPINPEAWMWYHLNVGKEKLPIVDTWWQTETGGILITPLPGAMTLKPGSATRPFSGVVPKVLKDDGSPAGVNEGGKLVIEKPWPGMLRGTYGDPENKTDKGSLFLSGTPENISPETGRGWMRTAITGLWAGSMTLSISPDTGSARRRLNRRLSATKRCRGRCCRFSS